MVQFLGNELFLWLLSDCDNGFIVSADVMDGETVSHTESGECIIRATKNIKKPINRW